MKTIRFFQLTTFCFLLISINEIQSASIVDSKRSETIAYLQNFGYLPEAKFSEKISDEMLREALKKFQVSGK